MKKYLVLICLILSGCNVMDNKAVHNTSQRPTIYPISHSTLCNAVPQDKQERFLKKLEKIRLGMLSTDVVDLLEISPHRYGPTLSKSLNAPIKSYSMAYDFDCDTSSSFIFIYFSPDERLKKIFFGKNIDIPKLDADIDLIQSNLD